MISPEEGRRMRRAIQIDVRGRLDDGRMKQGIGGVQIKMSRSSKERDINGGREARKMMRENSYRAVVQIQMP